MVVVVVANVVVVVVVVDGDVGFVSSRGFISLSFSLVFCFALC